MPIKPILCDCEKLECSCASDVFKNQDGIIEDGYHRDTATETIEIEFV